jgi:heat shock protein HtpX
VLAERAGLPAVPALYYLPSPVINAFTVGSAGSSAIALTDGLLRHLSPREIAGVLAHEVAHIAHGDLRVMGLADFVSRLTSLFSLTGQFLLLVNLPWLLTAEVNINWPALLLLVFSPQLALLAQLRLSRVREFDADLKAAALTGDPKGLAQALAHIEQASRSWRSLLLPGWGNPEPSWLRTHPTTPERIRRLLELVPATPAPTPWLPGSGTVPGFITVPVTRPPRWRIGGLWR